MEEERMEKKNRARGGVEQCLVYANIPHAVR
jgi:hypothetical protein